MPTSGLAAAPRFPADRLITKTSLLTASMLTVMAGATVAPALPDMREAFADTASVDLLVRLVITLPALFIVIGAPVAGYIVDRFGRKRLLIASMVVYAIAGSSGLFLPTLESILVGRALLGLSVAGIMTSVTTLITDYFVARARMRFLGLQAAFSGIGATIFLSMGGLLADENWRMPFGVYGLALLVAPLAVIVLYEPERPLAAPRRSRADTPFDERAPLLLMGFIYFMLLLVQIIFNLIPVQIPFYAEELVDAASTQTGFVLALMAACYAVGSILYGRLNPARFRHVPVMAFSFMVTCVGFGIVSQAAGFAALLVGLSVAGFSFGFVVPNLNVWLANSVPDAIRGRAMGGFATSLFLGQFLSPIVSDPFITRYGYSGIFGIAAGILSIMVVALTVGVLIRG